jgi:hypothetical protein
MFPDPNVPPKTRPRVNGAMVTLISGVSILESKHVPESKQPLRNDVACPRVTELMQ